ncbi:MAG TPA: NADH-quinone oxidoreductase subunit L [Ktedonobacterales bacterium]|nr:NADH-quinone oxidoreductase subunit L [Ktedonobacterales bacterium]
MVQYAWLIPALPLAALLIVLLVTRPLELAGRPRTPRPSGGAHGGGDGHDEHGAADAHEAQADEHDAHGGGHSEDGGSTPFWALISSVIAVLAMLGAFLISASILFQFLGGQQTTTLHLYNWFAFGKTSALTYNIDFRVDALTAIMLVVVTGVSMLVHLYSVGYMRGDPGYSRFFIELSLFTVSMLILVLGANFLVLFIGWELVGLSSYLLIGFWFDQAPPADPNDPDTPPYPPPAALKAFVTTRLGDFGFMIGILILFLGTRTFDFVQLQTATKSMNIALLTLAMILVFAGAVGKSAQFPLHVWLPDAMAGPTPVSALIHAATMVAAGVYLVARLFPIYSGVAGPQALEVVGYIGGFTALFAATIALTQNDIKKVLAYSTVSQLGYMFVGLAVADTNATGMFHLASHAAFKALLFLGSGCVILAAHHIQDMRKMGGMARFMPITAAMFLVATLAISGIPPLAGFWSKDAIIATAYEYGTAHGGNYWLYGITLFTAFLTAFYMFRLYFMTFGGRGGVLGFWGGSYRGDTAHGEPREAPWTMWLPLVILVVPTILVGFWSINSGFANYLTGEHVPYANPFADALTYIGVAVAIVGILLSWLMYGVEVLPKTLFTANPVGAFIYRVLHHKYYLDELYDAIIKYIVLGLSKLAELFDLYIIDGLVNGSARFVRGLGRVTSRSETGLVQNYGAAMFGGVIVILVVVIFAVGAINK